MCLTPHHHLGGLFRGRISPSRDSIIVVNDTQEYVPRAPHPLVAQNPAPYPTVSQVMANLSPTQDDLQTKVVQLQQELVCAKLQLKTEMENVAECRDKLIGLAAEANELEAVVVKYKDSVLLQERRIKHLTEENDNLKADLATKDVKLKEALHNINDDADGGTIYFRGFRNPLSAFFPCKLEPREGVGTGLYVKSAEHLTRGWIQPNFLRGKLA